MGISMDVKLLDPKMAEFLERATTESAGLDLRASAVISPYDMTRTPIGDGRVTVYPGHSCRIGSGLSFDIGSVLGEDRVIALSEGLTAVGLLLPRSGVGIKYRVRLSNTIGVIDADYQGEVIMVLENNGTDEFSFKAYDRITQLLFVPVWLPTFNVVEAFETETMRGAGGFGSTGTS